MNIIKNPNATSKGIILDASMKVVGEFKLMTAEDSYGFRDVFNLSIDLSFINISRAQSNADLLFLFVDETNEKGQYKIIDTIGLGLIHGQFLCNDKQAIFNEAKFVKTPKKNQYAN
jgi:hypothetical protein